MDKNQDSYTGVEVMLQWNCSGVHGGIFGLSKHVFHWLCSFCSRFSNYLDLVCPSCPSRLVGLPFFLCQVSTMFQPPVLRQLHSARRHQGAFVPMKFSSLVQFSSSVSKLGLI